MGLKTGLDIIQVSPFGLSVPVFHEVRIVPDFVPTLTLLEQFILNFSLHQDS